MNELTDETHAHILNAYVSRLTLNQIEQLAQDARDCAHAAMNLGQRSQLAAQESMEQNIQKAISHMLKHDKGIVEKMMREHIERNNFQGRQKDSEPSHSGLSGRHRG